MADILKLEDGKRPDERLTLWDRVRGYFDPVEITFTEFPWKEKVNVLQISYASDAELVKLEQLARQGKTDEVIKYASSGWKFRPEMGDHDGKPQRFV